jgi:hypothetical protein
LAKLISGLMLAVLLVACAYPQAKDYSDWMQQGKVSAERGELKWSEYYLGCFSRLADMPNGVEGKSAELEYYHTMIGYAQDYENGRTTKPEFEEKRRLAQIAKARNREAQMSAHHGEHETIQLQTTY